MPVARQLVRYRGAVRIMRRAFDEIIHTSSDMTNDTVRFCCKTLARIYSQALQELLRRNRGNWLIAALLRQRYPELFLNGSTAPLPADFDSWPFEHLL